MYCLGLQVEMTTGTFPFSPRSAAYLRSAGIICTEQHRVKPVDGRVLDIFMLQTPETIITRTGATQ
jgi:hypothetical protein